MNQTLLSQILSNDSVNSELKNVALKVLNHERISETDGVLLYEKGDLGFLGMLANFVREDKHKDSTFFNRNFHIEPTNICIYNCTFCSYVRKHNQEGAWEFTIDEIVEKVKLYDGKPVTEVHIVGGTHPQRDLEYYCEMLRRVKAARPDIHIKAFTAVEFEYMFKKSNVSAEVGFQRLKEAGLGSIPGGGAEIFDETIRKTVCPEKTSGENWLKIHETAHKLGIQSNATILYGHIENYSHRIDHLNRLRLLQDKTGGFNAFIPLKYRKENNKLSHLGEVSIIEDLKNYAVSRIFLDNIPHIKAYWPMIGKATTQIALSFGVDDIDGTIDDTTKIYSMAGVEDKSPAMNTEQMVQLIKQVGRKPIERDTLYNFIQEF